MCGVLALILARPENYACAEQLHDALYTLQHRGQDACGLATCAAGGRIFQYKGMGRAEDVFKNGLKLNTLPGYMGLGHLRYPTISSNTSSESQPLYVNSPYGIVLVHNGNLVNTPELKQYLDLEAHRHLNTDSDSEVILNIFADELNMFRKSRVNRDDLVTALKGVYSKCKGAWACAAMLAGYGILGFRDSYGIRPLVLGERLVDPSNGTEKDYMLASETPALRQRGFKVVRDIAPGECVIIERGKEPAFSQIEPPRGYCPDVFEFVYFSRFDAIQDGISVLHARKEMGFQLANAVKSALSEEELNSIDVVIPVPETAIPSGKSVAKALGKPCEEGFCKNRYVFRTFITSGQRNREQSVRRKLAPIDIEFQGRVVLLVDDSVVRGTTSRDVVSLARQSGAVKVYFASCAPRIAYPHIYGIDLPAPSELIAHARDDSAIAKYLGVEKIIFNSLDDLKDACRRAQTQPTGGPTDFEAGVFSGKYSTLADGDYPNHLKQMRAKIEKRATLDDAQYAVVNGSATDQQRQMVERETTAKDQEAISLDKTVQSASGQNGTVEAVPQNEEAWPTDRMDISLHNFGDYR